MEGEYDVFELLQQGGHNESTTLEQFHPCCASSSRGVFKAVFMPNWLSFFGFAFYFGVLIFMK